MDPALQAWIRLAQGPIFRLALALMLLGLLRNAMLAASDAVGAYVVESDRARFWSKVRVRVLWLVFPPAVLLWNSPQGRRMSIAYEFCVSVVSLVFRAGIVLVPAFMAAHVYLWERGFGVGWPTLPSRIADIGAVVTLIAGVVVLLGKIYSPFQRSVEPAWAFLRPLVLLAPLLSGVLAMHPTWSPADYYVVILIHMLSAAVAFVMIPFAGLLSDMRVPVDRVLPEMAWQDEPPAAPTTPTLRRPQTPAATDGHASTLIGAAGRANETVQRKAVQS